jgi:hypothetical protein
VTCLLAREDLDTLSMGLEEEVVVSLGLRNAQLVPSRQAARPMITLNELDENYE